MGGFFRKQVAGQVRAVDGVSFAIERGETLALVGESGCGKSTTGRLLTRLIEPTAGHRALRQHRDLELGAEELRTVRRRMQLVFQDAGSSFNPRMTVAALIAEPMHLAGASAADCRAPGARAAAAGRARRRACRALSARILGRPAPEDRHRPRAGAAARFRGVRRAGIGARRLGAGAGHQPADRPAARVRADLSLHLARPARGASRRRPGGGDVSRPHRGDRRQGRRSTDRRSIPTPVRC